MPPDMQSSANVPKRMMIYSFKLVKDKQQLEEMEEIELYCYKQFIKIWFYVDTMYNYEITAADMEFLIGKYHILNRFGHFLIPNNVIFNYRW